MANSCTTCKHLRLTRNGNGTVTADCGKMAAKIICGKCRVASDVCEWASAGRAVVGDRFCPRCPSCRKPQAMPSSSDWRVGVIGTVAPGTVIVKPAWCLAQWYERDEMAGRVECSRCGSMIDPESECQACAKRKTEPQQRSLF